MASLHIYLHEQYLQEQLAIFNTVFSLAYLHDMFVSLCTHIYTPS